MNTTPDISIALNCFSASSLKTNITNLSGLLKPEAIFACGSACKSPKTEELKIPGLTRKEINPVFSGKTLTGIITDCPSPLLALVLKPGTITLKESFCSEIAELFSSKPETLLAYSAHEILEEQTTSQPLIDFQEGSYRDDFDFGPLVILNVEKFKKDHQNLIEKLPDDETAWYSLWLHSTLSSEPQRIPEATYQITPLEEKDSEKDHFNYVDPRNAECQKRLEDTFTAFTKKAGFYLDPSDLKSIEFSEGEFPVEASVIIPVRNREGTVKDAVESALAQNASFKFNVIVADNHSTDKTTEILAAIADKDSRLVHLIPEAQDLQIGGCWNLALNSTQCGKFAVQLDSDDIYKDKTTLQKVVDCFHKEKAAAVVGAYTIVDFDLNILPPGLIDHKEWTDENGHNNALRINGFGAPRAYYTPAIREVLFPNLSYGEDYAAMLGICRKHKIARIYDSLYLCRRWGGNTDSNPSIEKSNRFNTIKDGLRTEEIRERKKLKK